MNPRLLSVLRSSVAAGSLLATPTILDAASETLLEGFENGVSGVAPLTWGGRGANGQVAFAQHARTGETDPNVTQGDNSLQISLTTTEYFSWDFDLILNEGVSDVIREVMATGQAGRYLLRYDVVFPSVGNSGVAYWMNSLLNFGSFNEQLEAGGGGKRTLSIALDLLTGLPASGPITIHFAHNFDAIENPFEGPILVYLDNVRLTDTGGAGATPVVIPLQSFEAGTGGAAVFTGWGGTARTSFSQYERSGPDDPLVTEGFNSLKVDFAGAGGWNADFTIPFDETALADILGLDLPADQRPTPAQLERYSLRFDVAFPATGGDWNGDWMNLGPHTLADDLGYTLTRGGGAGGRTETYSVPLDQVRWADWTTPKPQLMFILNGAWGSSGTTLYLDNFRLIDNGSTVTPDDPRITQFQFDRDLNRVTLTWHSKPGKTYAILYSAELPQFSEVLVNEVPSAGATTTYTTELPELSNQHFFIVRENP